MHEHVRFAIFTEIIDLFSNYEWKHGKRKNEGPFKGRHYLETANSLYLTQEEVNLLHAAVVKNFWIITPPSVEDRKFLFFKWKVKKIGDIRRRPERRIYIELNHFGIKIMDAGSYVGRIINRLKERGKIVSEIKMAC